MEKRGRKPGTPKTGGGSRKGCPNKATAAKAAAIAASGLTPLDYMLAVMRDESRDVDTRLEAAKSAAPYVHPRLSNIEHGTKDGKPLVVQIVKFGAKTSANESDPT